MRQAEELGEAQERASALAAALKRITDCYEEAPGYAAPIPTTELVWSMYDIARAALSPKAESNDNG